jgi:predicted phage tail protein
MTRIYGAGGGGGGKGGGGGEQRTPTEASDNLNSTQYASVLDLISEGEIQGLKNGLQSVFLNNTPVQNANGSLNFQDVQVITRNGTQAQAYIPTADAIEDEKPVGVQVLQATPIVRSVTDANVNAARISITVPQLQRFTDEGDIVGSVFRLQIAVQYNGGGYTTVIDDTIAGRSADQYQRDYLVGLASTPADIRVTRVTNDSSEQDQGGSSTKIVNAFNWSSYTEITYAKLRYPNSALVGLRVDAQQFSSIPTRSYLVRGIKVQIPSNATVDSTNGRLIYAGIWNGSFGAAQWTTDPAWCLWDLLTSTRYGFGDHVKAAQLDKFAFFAASQYASALVPDGFGSTEPRFSCNINIQTAEDAYKLINDMCSIFRVMPYWNTGALTVSQDSPGDSAYLFTLANVTEEGFSYQGSSRKTRPTVAVVSYLDLNSRDIAYEVVEDQAAIIKFGVVTTQISAFACTSRGQASRIGEWLLYSEHYESEVINFTASIDAGVVVRPGQIIEVSDPVKAGSRRGGRISTATTTTVTVDDATGLAIGTSTTLSVILPTGTVESRSVTAIVGNVVSLATALTTAPNANSVWIFETSNIQTSTWRVLTVSEQDGAQYSISALAYNSGKYDYIERGALLQQRDITDLGVIPSPPTNLQSTETIYESNGRALVKLIISWRPVLGVNEYRVRWRQENGNWTTTTQARPDYEILDTTAALYEIQVYSLNALRQQSVTPANFSVQAFGKTAVPGNVENLTIETISANSARLRWDPTVDLDVKLGGRVHIRHTNLTDGTGTWSNSVDLIPAIAGVSTEVIVPLVEGEILVKFEDDGGRQSPTEASVIVDFPDALGNLLVQSRREDADSPPYQGTKTDVFYSDEFDALVLDGDILFDSIADLDLLSSMDYPGAVQEIGTYEFANTVDLGAVFSLDLSRFFVTAGFFPNDLVDSRTAEVDGWADWDGGIIDQVNAKLYLRRTPDNPASSPTWSSWQEFVNGTFLGRGFQFKAELSSSNPAQNILIDQLGYEATFQRRTEQSVGALTSGAASYSVTFGKPFFTGTSVLGGLNTSPPSIGITAQNLSQGDFFNVTNVTSTGFDVIFRNSAGTAVSRNFLWSAVGFGKGG